MSQDSDLVHASSLPPLLVKSNCVISKENSGIISPLFPTNFYTRCPYFTYEILILTLLDMKQLKPPWKLKVSELLLIKVLKEELDTVIGI